MMVPGLLFIEKALNGYPEYAKFCLFCKNFGFYRNRSFLRTIFFSYQNYFEHLLLDALSARFCVSLHVFFPAFKQFVSPTLGNIADTVGRIASYLTQKSFAFENQQNGYLFSSNAGP